VAIPLILDTDIGDDVDDALALALAVGSPEVELVGVTTVYQCAGLRARLARHLLAAYGRPDVPVQAGVDRPLLGRLRPAWVPNQAAVLREAQDGAGAEPSEGPEGPEAAIRLIVREGLRRQGLVLLTIGPMTNAALALALEPRLAGRLRVVAMAGAWDRQGGEYNVACDPEAVAAVLAAGVPVSFVGLDVTTRCVLPAADLERLSQAAASGSPAERVLYAFVRAWQGATPASPPRRPILHDPLALAAVFRPELLRWEDIHVAVELASPHLRGQTCRVPGGAPNARVARAVDAEAFLELFATRVCRRGA
jgi:purine nucleosidase